MAEYSEKIQALMDEAYGEWRKDVNKGKSKWDVLDGFPEANQVAVVFGNFNHQVENGGIEQWIYNGYFRDDAEKLTGYLEIGSKTDDRCRTILDRVYTLDQYAQETDCDRYGSFRDPDDEDGDGGFIGDIMDCDKFDTWYYENCGKEDWWETVCGIIEKVDPHGLSPSGRQELEEGAKIKHITADELKRMTGAEGLVLQSCGGDPAEWLKGINDTLTEVGILHDGGAFKDIYVFQHEGLTNILYPFDRVSPETLDVGKLAMWRLQTHDTFGGTWLSDYLPNKLGVNIDGQDIAGSEEHMPPVAVSGERPGTRRDGLGADDYADRDSESAVAPHPLRLYIENAKDERIGGFTIPLPTTKETLQPFLDGAEISGWRDIRIGEVSSDINWLGYKLHGMVSENMSPDTLNELNYLASKIAGLNETERAVFSANIEAGRNCGSVAEIVNLTFAENLNHFDLQPAFSEEQYGEFLLDTQKDETAEVFRRLEDSANPDEKAFAAYVLQLEAHIDLADFGRGAAKEENGVFTEQGYLTGGGELLELYRSPEDIPAELIVYEEYPSELRSLSRFITPETDRAELAYLADKIAGMDGEQRKVFDAVTETGWYCGSVAEIINVTDNLHCFTVQPVITDVQHDDNNNLQQATKQGYLVQVQNMETTYRGAQDLPAEYRASNTAPDNDRVIASKERAVPDEKPSVLAQIAEAREARRREPEHRESPAPGKKRSDPEL